MDFMKEEARQISGFRSIFRQMTFTKFRLSFFRKGEMDIIIDSSVIFGWNMKIQITSGKHTEINLRFQFQIRIF